MALVHRAIGREKVEVMIPFRVPDATAARAGKYNWQRMVIVRGKSGFSLDCGSSRGCMVNIIGKSSDRLKCRCGWPKSAAACGCCYTIRVRGHHEDFVCLRL